MSYLDDNRRENANSVFPLTADNIVQINTNVQDVTNLVGHIALQASVGRNTSDAI